MKFITDFESSNLAGYAFVSGEGLFVKFKTGVTYRYPEANEAHYTGLHLAESKGSYFHKFIRPQPAEKLDG